MKVVFKKKKYDLIITDHARYRMRMRNVQLETLIEIVENGEIKAKDDKNKYWIFKSFAKRKDNFICLSVKIEDPGLIVVTALINWSPQ
jgi:hypothetical protein